MIPGGFHSLHAAWLLGLIAPLVLLYFLKLKRTQVAVSSLVFWRRVLEDRRVNSPFQRFKRNILLLLQILLLVLLVLAAMQPYLFGGGARARRTLLLLDCSASMGAQPAGGGPTRLEEAKRQAGELIGGMGSGQEMSIVTFSRAARQQCPFTSQRRVLQRSLEDVAAEDMEGGIEEVLRLARALAQGSSVDRAVLFSDGNFPPRADVELSFPLEYRKIAGAGPNVGITVLSARRAGVGKWVAFAQVEGSAQAEGSVTVEFRQDGTPVATQSVLVGGGRAERVAFEAPGATASRVEARILPSGADSLASDNTAVLELPAARALRVHVQGRLDSVRHCLDRMAGLEYTDAASCDLAIGGSALAEGRAQVAVMAGATPSGVAHLVYMGKGSSCVVDWEREHPLLRHAPLASLVTMDRPALATGATEAEFERRGFEILVHGQGGPLVLEQQGARRRYWMLFDPERSTLPYQVGFPVIWCNAVELALQGAGLAEVKALPTGLVSFSGLAPGKEYEVSGPGGLARTRPAGPDGVIAGIPASQAGVYRAKGATGEAVLSVSLLSARETCLMSVDTIGMREGLRVEAAGPPARAERDLWPFVAMGAFVVLLIEWWFFHRPLAPQVRRAGGG